MTGSRDSDGRDSRGRRPTFAVASPRTIERLGWLIDKPMYPLHEDYEMTASEAEILTCKTFFAICEKR